MRKKLSALLIALLILASLPLTVYAAGPVEMGREVSLKLTYAYEELKLEGVEFDIYLLSTMDEVGELTPVPAFAAYEGMLDIRGKNDAAWYAAADALNIVVQTSDSIQPTASAVTDAEGIAEFSDDGKTLTKGLYLVTATTHTLDGYIYSTKPFMVLLPARDAGTDAWRYSVSVAPKKDRLPVVADYTVKKEWEDYGEGKHRPKSITIYLYCDDELYDKIKLPYEGNWSYTWEDLDTNHKWSVKEDKVNGYKDPKITREGNIFYVKNVLNKPKLPQTGQLNWPVPVMAAAGLTLFAVGWVLCFGRRKESYAK